MRTLGLIGGTSPASTLVYYQQINKIINEKLGGHNSAKIILASVNFDEIVNAIYSGQWNDITSILKEATQQLLAAKVDCIAICSNTLHRDVLEIKHSIPVPLLHIVDYVGAAVSSCKIKKIGLLGSIFTMQDSFYKEYLLEYFNIETIVPSLSDQEKVNDIIFNELCRDISLSESGKIVSEIIINLEKSGAEGIILGCTELPLLLKQIPQITIPFFNSTLLHSQGITRFILSNNSDHPSELNLPLFK